MNSARSHQEILAAAHRGDLVVPDGLVVAGSDSLCRRSLESGRPWVATVPDTWPDPAAVRAQGIVTDVSVPIVWRSATVFGTLCAASGPSRARKPGGAGADAEGRPHRGRRRPGYAPAGSVAPSQPCGDHPIGTHPIRSRGSSAR